MSYGVNVNMQGMNFQGAVDSMTSAMATANSSLNAALSGMKAGDPTTIINVQVAMSQFSQIMSTLTQTLKSLSDSTAAANRNIG